MTFDAAGKLVQKRIEQSAGISDPAKFKLKFPNVELIQDDVYFNAAKVSVGLMGIFYSVTVRTQASFFLEETREMHIWSELKPVIFDKLSDKTIHSIHIWFNPYPVAGENSCVLSEYRRVSGPAKGKRPFGVTFGLIPELAPLILWTMEHFPNKLPEIINSTLKATVNKSPVVMPCPEALNFGTPNLTKVDACNCGIPLEKLIEVADRLFQLAASRVNEGAFISVPPGFRFTAEAQGFLAPQYKRETCMIEMPFIRPTPHAMDSIDAFLQLYMNDFAGRPHWGQRLNQNVTPVALKNMYPELQSFQKIFDAFNYNGIFDNEFSQKIGLS
ncbi:D-arabinono-1,4-lactone oxidase [Mucilaginibacter sp. UYCu711]|uniref:D-arabinono-1,4-lactone oxidase n=1 Tax=Mucilaginibacter sp. UYCu711 TaxID=3156339 RepID=UPI003D1D3E3C